MARGPLVPADGHYADVMYPGGGANQHPPDPGRNLSPEARGCLSLVVRLGGVLLVVLTASLWSTDMPALLRVGLLVLDASVIALGRAGLLRRGR